MTTLRTLAKGYEHNRLAEVAKSLESDGHTELAADYRGRADRAKAAFTHLRELDFLAGGDGVDAKRGLDILEGLVQFGWTPPAYMLPRDTES